LENRTAILIAHRHSTAMKADRIVVVSDGEIVEKFASWMRHSGGAETGE
jgi:ABC-type transport system involved in Fe-S cluster assembly fused permease/ATPase subunit